MLRNSASLSARGMHGLTGCGRYTLWDDPRVCPILLSKAFIATQDLVCTSVATSRPFVLGSPKMEGRLGGIHRRILGHFLSPSVSHALESRG